MDVKILYISTERKNNFFHQEIQRGIDTLQSEISSIHSNFVELYGISVSKNENADSSIECSIIEKKYDWINNENSLSSENDIADISNMEVEDMNLHDYYLMSECLHKYADLHCENGSTVVYILWCVQDYLPCPSEVVEFYGSLKRFHWWHNASINIVTNNFEAVEDWLSYLPLQIVGNCEEVINNISQNIWRGSLVFSVEGKSSLIPLAEVNLRSESKNFNLFNFCCDNKAGEKVYILPTAEVLTDISLGTIPWPFIQKDSLCYISPSPNLMEKDKQSAMKMLESLTHSEEIGTLFRIRYSNTPPTLQGGLEAANTDTWKQMIAQGNFDQNFNLGFQGQHDAIVLLMLSKDPLIEWVYCVALTDPSSYGEDIVKLVFQEQLNKKVFSMENELKVLNLFRGTMQFSNLEAYALSNILLHLPTTMRKQFLKKGKNADDIPLEEKLRIECCSSKAILNKFILPSVPVELHPCNTVIHPEVSLPVESFPEYKALEEKEKKKKSAIARCTSGDFLCGLPPPVIPQKTKGMDITQILTCFADEKGTLSNDKSTSWDTRILDRKWIKNVSWRDALHLKCHGIYYNNGEQQEKFESRCGRLKEQVTDEIASSCTIFQKNLDSTRSHHNRPKTHQEEKINRKNAFGVLRNSSHRPFFDSDSCSSRSFSVPLRRSPRKLMRDAKPADLSGGRLLSRMNSTISSSAYSSRVFKPSELTEVHKQKLRNVVLTVLEMEGITMKHELFKLCFKKLFTVCKPFALDVIGQGATTRNFEKIAKSHVKQVVHFEKRKNTKRKL